MEKMGGVGDAVEVAGDMHRVVLDNEKIRVLEYRLNPGDKAELHTHPDHLMFHLGPQVKMRFTSEGEDTEEVDIPAGSLGWNEAGAHVVENVDSEQVSHGIIVEVK